MEAIQKLAPAPGVHLMQVDEPRPQPGEVLIRVAAAGICGSDLHIDDWAGWEGAYARLMRKLPVTLGHEFAGEVVALGAGVTQRKLGERVVVQCLITCGQCFYCRRGLGEMCTNRCTIGLHRDGAFAPLVAVPADSCIALPDAVSLRVAAMTEPMAVGARAVAMSGMADGDTVAILGPGMIGIGLVLMAKEAGAGRIIVAGTSRDAARLDVCKALGAELAIDVRAEALVPRLMAENGGEGVDVVFEATGHGTSVTEGLASVRQGGGVVAVGIHDKPIELDLLNLVRGRRRVIGSHASRRQDWDQVIRMMAVHSARLEDALVSHALPFERGVEGFRLSRESGAVKVMLVP